MKILVVDDDQSVRDRAAAILRREGHTVVTARDGEDALMRVDGEGPDLVLLDHLLPGVDGIEVCCILRARSDVPVIMMIAGRSDIDKVAGSAPGADDYLLKPFTARDLTARVRAVVGRVARGWRPAALLLAGPLVVDRARREARVGGRLLTPRPKGFDLLVAFIDRTGLLLSREQLLGDVWGYDVAGRTRTVDVHVSHLRILLSGTGVTIETVRGAGYRFVVADEATARRAHSCVTGVASPHVPLSLQAPSGTWATPGSNSVWRFGS